MGSLVYLEILVWNFKATTFNNDALKISLPVSCKALRCYGHTGYNSTGIGHVMLELSGNGCGFILKKSDGRTEVVTGNQLKGKTFQFSVLYPS